MLVLVDTELIVILIRIPLPLHILWEMDGQQSIHDLTVTPLSHSQTRRLLFL